MTPKGTLFLRGLMLAAMALESRSNLIDNVIAVPYSRGDPSKAPTLLELVHLHPPVRCLF
jgi:hypothetical protein